MKNLIKKILREEYYESLKPVDKYIDADDLLGQRVWIHTNRSHRRQGRNGMIGIYNSNTTGRRVGSPLNYTNEISLSNVIFDVDYKCVKRIQSNTIETGKQKRTLCAGTSGTVIETNNNTSGFELITFDPFDVGHEWFYRLNDNDKEKIVSADEVYFIATESGDYNMYAKGLGYES
jgi:hypothetical protein